MSKKDKEYENGLRQLSRLKTTLCSARTTLENCLMQVEMTENSDKEGSLNSALLYLEEAIVCVTCATYNE